MTIWIAYPPIRAAELSARKAFKELIEGEVDMGDISQVRSVIDRVASDEADSHKARVVRLAFEQVEMMNHRDVLTVSEPSSLKG